MNAIGRFYATAGRLSPPPFILVAAGVAVVLFAVTRIDWQGGVAANLAAGAVGGAAVGKLLTAAIRRLRSAGIDLRLAAWAALAAGLLALAAFLAFLASDPPWADVVLTGLGYVVPVACGIALLWPARTTAGMAPPDATRTGSMPGLAIAALCVAVGAATMGFIAWLSIGMHDNHRARALEANTPRSVRQP